MSLSFSREMDDIVLRLMDEANAQRLVPHPRLMKCQDPCEEGYPVPGSESDCRSPVFRGGHSADEESYDRIVGELLAEPNFVQKLRSVCELRGQQNALAYRTILRAGRELVKDPSTGAEKPFDVIYYDARRYITYEQLWNTVMDFGYGLRLLELTQRSKVALYLDTRWEWMASAYGAWTQGITLVTVFANLGHDALCEAFTETSCGAIITAAEKVPALRQMMEKGEIPAATIIYLDGPLTTAPDSNTSISVYSWEDVVGWQKGERSSEGIVDVDSDDLALIMYTSGTTGQPKGVMHTYNSITAGIASMARVINTASGELTQEETYVTALPLAHIFEFAVTNVFMMRGALIGFGNPRTLLSTHARPCGDYEEYRPMFLIGVPRIFDVIKKTVESQLPARGTLERQIYDHAFQSRLKSLAQGMETPYWNEVIFAPFRSLLGGRVRIMFGGGAPISAATQTFMNVVIGNFTQGWGLTETVANGAAQLFGDLETVCVGPAKPGVEFQLLDVEGYSHKDLPEPAGEICIRGPCVFKGYFKKEKETSEVLDANGWFRTGDIGSIADRGRLRIISRIKSLAKNSLGEYIAMEALESLYAQSPLALPNGVAVLVQPSRNYICAIAITQEAFAMKFAHQHRLDGTWPEILTNADFRRLANESFRRVAIAAGRGTHEVVRRVRVVADVWAPENNVLTAAGKLRRGEISARYKDIIQELFVE